MGIKKHIKEEADVGRVQTTHSQLHAPDDLLEARGANRWSLNMETERLLVILRFGKTEYESSTHTVQIQTIRTIHNCENMSYSDLR